MFVSAPFRSFSQSEPECLTPEVEENVAYSGGGCIYDGWLSSLPTNGCNNFMQYAPIVPQYMPIKTVRLVMHVFQKDDGTRNFQDTPADRAILQSAITSINGFFSNVESLSNPVSNCPSETILDTRIRFQLSDIFFYQDSDAWIAGNVLNTEYHGCDVYDYYVANNSNLSAELKENAIHILLVGCRTDDPDDPNSGLVFLLGGYSAGIPVNGEKFIMEKGWYYGVYESSPTPNPGFVSGAATNMWALEKNGGYF